MSRRSWVQSPVWSLFCTLTSRSMASKTIAKSQGQGQEQKDAGSYVLHKTLKVQNLRKSFSMFKASFASVIFLRYRNHSECMSHSPTSLYVTQIIHREPHRRTYMRQSVMLTGLSSSKFNNAMASTCAIEDMFQQVIPTGTMDDWAPSSFQGYTTIDISNRYFTPAHLASQHVSRPRPYTIGGNGKRVHSY